MIPGKKEKKGREAEKEGEPVLRDVLLKWPKVYNSQILVL